MDLSYIPYLELGIYTEVWSGCLLLPSVPANRSQDFLPLAFVILPILLPMNAVHGRGPHFATGKFARNDWTNVSGWIYLGGGTFTRGVTTAIGPI